MAAPLAAPEEVTPERRPYRPRGAARLLLLERGGEALLSGAAGTGKSRACLEKLHLCAEKYPGMRGLIVRKTRESLTESALVTFEEHVVPEGHPALRGPSREHRRAYHYPNGSVIVAGGLRQAGRDVTQKVMSTEYDLAYAQEAIELSEEEWEKLTTRLRNGKMPYQQLIADTNPDRPTHWLRARCVAGRTVLLESRHEDNPRLWDGAAWTEEGRNYLATLDRLTGPRLQRLRHGRWVQAEGVVYDGWDAKVHVVDDARLVAEGILTADGRPNPARVRRVLAGVDWGFTHPGAIEVGAVDGDGRLWLVREVYHSRKTIDWWIDQAKKLRDEWGVEKFVCDPSEPAYLEQFRQARLRAEPAQNDVAPGIGAVAQRLRVQEDGRPRLYVRRAAPATRDEALAEAKQPTGLVDEMDSYVWNTAGGRKKGEEPVKEHDHACDAIRYLCMELEKPQRRAWVL